jgi:hypothetical protein
MKKKAFYFTCGQTHVHSVGGGRTWNKDSVLQVNAPDEESAREKVFELFGGAWGFCYDDKEDVGMGYYSGGICAVIEA